MKKTPEKSRKISSSGIHSLKEKYSKESFHPELDESKEVEASKLAEKLHEQGYAARQRGDLDKAIQYYSQALDLCPDFHTVGRAH